jgi:hypothetical protein
MAWYTSTYQWRKVRKVVLERDGYICRINGLKCTMTATEVDHVVPVEDGGPVFDPENLRASCKPCNVGRAQRQKRDEGWRRSDTWIVLVTGPPTSGKSTYIREHRTPGDLVIDWDAMREAMGGASVADVNTARNALIRKVKRGEVDAPRVWLHSANPKATEMFPYHELVALDPGQDEVTKRCEVERPAGMVAVANDWYAGSVSHERQVW